MVNIPSFLSLYEKMIQWSRSPQAEPILCLVAFSESSFFPIPPDPMLISMGLAKPDKSLWYAFLTVFFSVLGGLFGYILGYYAMHWIEPFLKNTHYFSSYQTVSAWFNHYGVWIVFIAGFSPIPFKIFTVTAGAMGMPLTPFLIASFLGRGGRFFLVSTLIYFWGVKIDHQIRKYVNLIGWWVVIIIIIGYVIYKCV